MPIHCRAAEEEGSEEGGGAALEELGSEAGSSAGLPFALGGSLLDELAEEVFGWLGFKHAAGELACTRCP